MNCAGPSEDVHIVPMIAGGGTRILPLLVAGLVGMCGQARAAFELASPNQTSTVLVPAGEPECVRLAAGDLVGDVAKITGKAPAIVGEMEQCGPSSIVLVSLNQARSTALLEGLAPGFGDDLKGKWEAYRVGIVAAPAGARLVVAGSDERGTMFGLYAFIESYLGVDPLYFWSGRQPDKRDALRWDSVEIVSAGPSFRFRGWFINDEDLLTEWRDGGGERRIDYPYYAQVVGRDVMRAIAEALVRSRSNLIIPASFIDILNPPEEALVQECVRRGVFVSQHHVEPMGVSAFSYFNYWKKRGRDLKYSYFSHPGEVREVWRAYAKKWAAYPNVIWQLGLRGIADRPMWMADPSTPQSDADRGRLISEAMAAQVKILDEVCPAASRHLSTTLWAEGSVLNQKGFLTIPEGTIIVFADNSPGWKWQQDFYSTPRNPKNAYGVYYHHGLIGCGPHLAQVPSPHKTHQCLKEAADKGAGEYVICNVANIREFVLGIDATSKMTWRMEGFDPDEWLGEWVRRRFSRKREEIANAYRVYFNAWQIHDEQRVPFLMDGQMFGMGMKELGQIAKKLKGNKVGVGTDPEKDRQRGDKAEVGAATPAGGDAFWSGLGDTNPRSLGRRETIKRVAAQKAGFAMALLHARTGAAALPEREVAVLSDNLVYQAAIMFQTSEWLEQVGMAHEALDLGNIAGCVDAIEIAERAFGQIPVLAEGYCRGRWENWYRGCRKLNVAATLKRTRDVLEQARQANLERTR
ncbi:MAG TPA: glycosyl hydrolase 115 family protein [Verrucomicrobiae bacterium]|nr:glycosyl hydrolase 115 family protein [Verrucomicrobiae bacterium]